jgi:hypothetical protein
MWQHGIYSAPISGSLTPSATFNNGANCLPNQIGGLAFSPSGDLFAATGKNQINIFTRPFSPAGTVSQTITSPGMSPRELFFDLNGNLYFTDTVPGSSQPTPCGFIAGVVFVIRPPYTGAPITTSSVCGDFAFDSVALNSTQLFVSADNGSVMVYDLPIATGAFPVFIFRTRLDVAATLAVDRAGNLYVNDGQMIRVFAAPVSSSSVPILTINASLGDIATGP